MTTEKLRTDHSSFQIPHFTFLRPDGPRKEPPDHPPPREDPPPDEPPVQEPDHEPEPIRVGKFGMWN